MANLFRMKKVTARVNERNYPFVVHVAVPDGGFECTLDAINAWHCYSGSKQRRGQRHRMGDQEFWSWCFDGLEIAKAFRHRFGGEIVPVTVRRRSYSVSKIPPAAEVGRMATGPKEAAK